MFTYTNPRNSHELHNIKPSPFSTNQKRKLFFEDNVDKNISQSEVYDPEQFSPEKSNTKFTELSPTLSEKFESLISKSKHEHLCSSSITTDKKIEQNTTTPLNSKKIKGDKNLPNKIFNLNTIKNNKAEYEVKASCSYDYKTVRNLNCVTNLINTQEIFVKLLNVL